MKLPELGVGVTYTSSLEPLILDNPGLVDVIEIEPQTLWLGGRVPGGERRALDGVFKHLAQLPFHKLVHSVGVPVGGSVLADRQDLALLAKNIRLLRSPWVSDHLSFNATAGFHTGFFLPQRQSREGIDVAVAGIQALQREMTVPVAVETGVNYFQPRPGDIPDGEFLAEIVERTGCGILLDLHNLYCNQINGRQGIEEFLAQIPLQDVWEVHLAGGLEMHGFWLDAHSGAIPAPLVALCRRIFPRLQNLKAAVFEIYPSFVAEVGLDVVRGELEQMREFWDMRGTSQDGPPRSARNRRFPGAQAKAQPACDDWESALGALVVGRIPDTDFGQQLARDPAVALVRGLIHEFRGSMLVGLLRLTSNLLMLSLGIDNFTLVMKDFWLKFPPEPFASDEALAFSG